MEMPTKILRLCVTFSNAPAKLFLSGSPEDERLFDILLRSYFASRYKSDFRVLMDDVVILFDKSVAFVALAKKIYNEMISQLVQQSILYQEGISVQLPVANH